MTTITIQLPLNAVSQRKEKRLQSAMERQQDIAQQIAQLMPSIDHQRWGNTRRDPVFHRWVNNEFPDNNGLRSHDANQVAYKVSENFKTWKTNGYPGNKPRYEEPVWARFCNCNDVIKYDENDGSWGVRLPLEPYNPEWFGLQTGSYQEDFLNRYKEEEVSFGDAELKKINNGFMLNQTVSLPVEEQSYTPETFIGVDMGPDNLATLVAVRNGEVSEVELFSGDRVRHYREKMRNIRKLFQEAGEQVQVEELRDLESRFCEQQNNVISKRIVEAASEYEKPGIVMEQLKGIRKRVNEQQDKSQRRLVNSWRYGDLQTKIQYKAEKEGIKTTKVAAAHTSQRCNRCGDQGRRPYQGNWSQFYCPSCDYQVNADFNGAVNIAERAAS